LSRTDRERAEFMTTNTRRRDLLTIPQAVQQAGVSRSTVAGWMAHGRLPTTRVDGRRWIRPADLATAQAAAHLDGVVPAWRQDRTHAGARLRQVREAAGVSQVQLAAASGISHEVISKLEAGRCSPRSTTVRTLAQALRVNPATFVGHDPLGPTLLTTAEAEVRLDVPAGRIQTWVKQGLLEGRKVSGQWRVPAIAVMELARSGRLRGRSRRLDPRYRG
jgi:transcriptional regulator with XRE-family HTH domain/predicted DNA-binding transcriptional regulator AlpA